MAPAESQNKGFIFNSGNNQYPITTIFSADLTPMKDDTPVEPFGETELSISMNLIAPIYGTAVYVHNGGESGYDWTLTKASGTKLIQTMKVTDFSPFMAFAIGDPIKQPEARVVDLSIAQPTDKPTGNIVSPETGDDGNTVLFIALMFISGGAVLMLGVRNKKRRNA